MIQTITAQQERFLFYNRQTIQHANADTRIFKKFEYLLQHYFTSEQPQDIGLPSVAYFADKLNLSPNYFGDLIKKTTGRTPRAYIHNTIISIAKQKIYATDQSISEIAYQLGFSYPQHFMRLFKQQLGCTPTQYRSKLKAYLQKTTSINKRI